MDPATHDVQLRQSAFDQVNRLSTLRGGILESSDLAGGFEFGGERISLINPQRGIIQASANGVAHVDPNRVPPAWRQVRYDDQREAHRLV